MDKLSRLAAIHSSYISKYHKYKMIFWDKWDYSFLSKNIMYYRKKGRFQKGTWNDVIIGADTETSKGHEITNEPEAFNKKPVQYIECCYIHILLCS